MFRKKKIIAAIMVASMVQIIVQARAEQQIYSICRDSGYFKNRDDCLIKSMSTDKSSFVRVNKDCPCSNNLLEMFAESIEDKTNSQTLTCIGRQSNQTQDHFRLKYPQEQCQSSNQCNVNECDLTKQKCNGRKEGESCNLSLGIYCNPSLFCEEGSNTCSNLMKQSINNYHLNKNDVSTCQTSYECLQNDFCHNGSCKRLNSLREGEELNQSENTLYKIGNSFIDIRCESLLVDGNKCSIVQKIDKNEQQQIFKLVPCQSSSHCTSKRQCSQVWDSSKQFYNLNKYQPNSISYCQINPNDSQFIQTLKNTYIDQLLKQNELCPLNIKLSNKCSLISQDLYNIQQLIIYIDNYHIITNSCFKYILEKSYPQITEFFNHFNNQSESNYSQKVDNQVEFNQSTRKLTDFLENKKKRNTEQDSGTSNPNPNPTNSGQQDGNNPKDSKPQEDQNNTDGSNNGKQNETPPDNNNNNNSNNNSGNNNDNNNNQKEDPDKKDESTSESDSGSSTTLIIVFIIVFIIIGCCGGVIYIRRRNENGFASLTAALENDKQFMMKKTGGMMSMGSGSNGNNMKVVSNSSDSSGNIQSKLKQSDEMQIVDQKKFSKRVINEDSKPSQQKEGSIPLKSINHLSGGELHLEQNNGIEYSDNQKTPSMKLTNNRNNQNHHRGSSNNVNNLNTGNPSQQQQGQKSLSHKAQGKSSQQERQNQTQQQDMEQQKNLDTSVQNNFFSIDGEDEEKHDKIMDSIQLDYQSDDTTYSNVFNLEGEESSKPHSNRKKKKKQKQQNHLFFDDKNEQ